MSKFLKEQTEIFKKWFDRLPSNVSEKIDDYINRIADGNMSNVEPCGNNVSEIRIKYQKGIEFISQ